MSASDLPSTAPAPPAGASVSAGANERAAFGLDAIQAESKRLVAFRRAMAKLGFVFAL